MCTQVVENRLKPFSCTVTYSLREHDIIKAPTGFLCCRWDCLLPHSERRATSRNVLLERWDLLIVTQAALEGGSGCHLCVSTRTEGAKVQLIHFEKEGKSDLSPRDDCSDVKTQEYCM